MSEPEKRIIDIFLKLVHIDAISGQEKPVGDFIRTFLKPYNLAITEDDAGKAIQGNSGNLIINIPGKNDRSPIALVSHMDTVKSTSGIKPKLQNGTITSDGSTILGADNRAGIALILALVEYLKTNNLSHRSFQCIFTIGEETGLYGARYLDTGLVQSKIAYILDSSADPGAYVYKSPGAREFKIQLQGKASHAAVAPAQGVNAITMAAEFIANIPKGQVDEQTTINIGKICGGEANNVIAPTVLLTGEIRSFCTQKLNTYTHLITKQLKQISNYHKGNYDITCEEAFPAFEIDLNHESIKQLDTIYRQLGMKPNPLRYHGGSDANILNNRRLTAIDMGIGAKNPHSHNEYIRIEDLLKISQVIRNLVV